MIEFFNIKKSSGGGDGSSLNIFTQLDEPTIKNGIWLKKDAIPEHYTYDEDVFVGGEWAADGTYNNCPIRNFRGFGQVLPSIGTNIFLFTKGWDSSCKYDTLTDTYTQISNPVYDGSCQNGSQVVIGTDIYLFGGDGGYYSDRKKAQKYDTLTDTYTQLTNIPYDFYYGSAVVVGTNIYLFGGSGGSNTVYKYDTLTDTYTQLTNMPYNYVNGSAVSIGNTIYLFGSGNGTKQQAYKYDTLTDTYTQLTDIPYQCNYIPIAVAGTDIYIFGSVESSNEKNAYKYDTLTDTYTQLNSSSSDTYFGGAVAVGTKIYVFLETNLQVYILESKTYQEDNLVVISQGRYNDVGYETELYSNSKDVTSPKYAFADAWYYTTQGGLETDIPTYYGDGTQWINIKNPPVVASE